MFRIETPGGSSKAKKKKQRGILTAKVKGGGTEDELHWHAERQKHPLLKPRGEGRTNSKGVGGTKIHWRKTRFSNRRKEKKKGNVRTGRLGHSYEGPNDPKIL